MNSRKYHIVLSAVMAAIILTAIIAVAGMFYLDETSEKLHEKAMQYETKDKLFHDLWDIARDRTITLQNMVIETDAFERDTFYLNHEKLAIAFGNTRNEIIQMGLNQEETALMAPLDQLTQTAAPMHERILKLLFDEQRDAAHNELHDPAYLNHRQKFITQFEIILAHYRDKTHEAFDEVNTVVLHNIHVILMLTAFMLLTCASIGFFMMRKVAGTEQSLRKEVEHHVETRHALELHRQHLEEEIQKEVEKYRRIEEARDKSQEIAYATGQILEDSLNEIYIFDVTSLRFIQVNKAARDNTGYSINELKQLTPLDLSPEMTIEDIRQRIRPLLNGTQDLVHFTNTLQRKDKTSYPIEIHLQLSMMEYSPVIVAMVLDITERQRIEEGLMDKTRELEQAQNELEYQKKAMDEHAIVCALTRNECLQSVNQKFIDISGFSNDELIGGHLCIGTSDDHPEEFFKSLSATIQHGVVWHGEICHHRADGSPYWTKTTITPFFDTNKEIDKFISVSTDFTALKQAEQALLAKTLEVEQAHRELASTHHQALQSEKLASVGQLAAGIAHEINTPIQFIGDNTRFLQDAFDDLTELITLYQDQCSAILAGDLKPDSAEKARSKSEEIDLEYLIDEVPSAISQSLDGIERVTRIVRSMKDFSHPGSDSKEIVDINYAIETTATVCKNEWKYDAELTTEFDPELNAVPCFPGELNQVLLNIIVNASHAIHDSRGTNEALGSIKIITKLDGDHAEIRIMDNGAGMPEEVRKRIFEPFFTTKGVGKGSGQGLAIAYAVVVDKHHGTIEVESEPGKGTTFIIRLPMDDAEDSEPENTIEELSKAGTA